MTSPVLTVVISGAEASARVPKNVQIQLCQFGGRQKYDTDLSERLSIRPSIYPAHRGVGCGGGGDGACDAKMRRRRLSRRESANGEGRKRSGRTSGSQTPTNRRACPTNGNGGDRGALATEATTAAAEGVAGSSAFPISLPTPGPPRLCRPSE